MSFNSPFDNDIERVATNHSHKYKDYPEFEALSTSIDNQLHYINHTQLSSIKQQLAQFEKDPLDTSIAETLSSNFKSTTESYRKLNDFVKRLNNTIKSVEDDHEDVEIINYLKQKESIQIKLIRDSLGNFKNYQRRFESKQSSQLPPPGGAKEGNTGDEEQQQLQLQLQLQQKIAPVAKTTTSTPVKVQDSTISKKIDEFVRLRSRIAAGNKTPEYRLHWVKMLIVATNYKLYSYINIKGEPIYQEQAVSNKAQFIKSSVTHILKLIKELSSGTYEADGVKCEAYFIYANLLKQDYLVSYNQDFNMEKNIDKAIDYYDRVLEINSKDFKALYKLGEIYEYEFDNEFNKAVEYYTAAAKFGYNRAILKMAMLYLQEPQMRSIKYMKYLKDLSNIDLNEVRLDEEDSSEMEEVIGLACYELGKIFEGIYPGDLTQDDEFIQKSLDMAPVNYAKSLTYYNKSAKLNCLLAQVRLGIVYERGELNRQRNPSKSIQWYIKASSSPLSFKRHPDAMVGLARWCLTGSEGASKHIPVPVPDRAVMWCKRAIDEFSSPDAMSFMGELCEMGLAKGRPQYWYEKAYKMGNREAGRKLGYSN